jgi:DegV family protein with EDD domain
MIGIITDSTCDIPDDLVEQYGITVVPQTIIWGEKQYRDRIDMKPVEFYERLTVDTQRPTTSQAGIIEFQNSYEHAASKGFTELIVLTVSSAMSGTYQMAMQAAKLVNIPVTVIDSKGPTMSLGWQVLAAARMRDSGRSINEILGHVNQIRSRLVQLVAMDTMEFLQKGGRIGGAVKWVGGLLNVKPLVCINHNTGLVEPIGIARTQKALVEMLYCNFFDMLNGRKKLHLAVLHGNAYNKAKDLAERIATDYNPVELIVNITGPVLGANTGPGALALCGYTEE